MNLRQKGFSLITAIFLLTVVAALVVFMVNLRGAQQATALYGVQGARALQAARSGIEWGIYESLNGAACPAATTFSVADPALSAFSIDVSCSQSSHTEGVTLITTYQLTSIASSGSYGTLDYVQRRIQATVSLDPP